MSGDYGVLFSSRLQALGSGGAIKLLHVGRFETQIGPTCGLVAVRIGAMALGVEMPPTVDDLLDFSLRNNYTKNGECFSGCRGRIIGANKINV